MRRLLIWLCLLLCSLAGLTSAPAAEPTIRERYSSTCPAYMRGEIPDDPGALRVKLEGLDDYVQTAFLGLSYPAGITVLRPPVIQLISEPSPSAYCGIAIYEGTGFNWGLPKDFEISDFNRYQLDPDAQHRGAIRVVIGTRTSRYEVSQGTLKLTRFFRLQQHGQFRHWRLQGAFTGKLALAKFNGRADKAPPESLTVTDLRFDCRVIEDTSPIPYDGRGEMQLDFDQFYVPSVSLETWAEYDPRAESRAFSLEARTPPGGEETQSEIEWVFRVRDAGNISWPLHGKYLLSRATADPPEILGQDQLPLVCGLIYRPEPDIEFHYSPSKGSLTIDSAQLMRSTPKWEFWRVKGSLSGDFLLNGNKLALGSTVTTLMVDPAKDFERVAITKGAFDVMVRSKVKSKAVWRQAYPGMEPNVQDEIWPLL